MWLVLLRHVVVLLGLILALLLLFLHPACCERLLTVQDITVQSDCLR
jgi:hypothetical protein